MHKENTAMKKLLRYLKPFAGSIVIAIMLLLLISLLKMVGLIYIHRKCLILLVNKLNKTNAN